MTYKHLAPFDPDRNFVAQTFFRASGVAVERGKPFDKSLVSPVILKTLYSTHKIGYADESASEAEGSVAPATMVELGGGWWAVGAPWLDEPEKVQGEDKARLRAQQIRDEGEPVDHHGVALLEGENGWWVINAAWLTEPEKVHGEEAARDRAAELRTEGPPADWVDASQLVGSDAFEASYEIDGETVQLGQIVAAAQAASGHPAEVWNKLEPEQRDPLIQAELDRRTKGGAGDGGESTPSEQDRIKALVAGNSTSVLTKLAEGLPGLASAHGKTAIATLIVAAGRDLKPAEDDAGGGAS